MKKQNRNKWEYNPLNMKGTWIGISIAGMVILLWGLGIQILVNETQIEGQFLYPWGIFFSPLAIKLILVGFLIGWGISSFFKSKKR